jgi:hypothetical protein
MKRKQIVNYSLLMMFIGFLLSIVGLFSGSITASSVTEAETIIFFWIILAIIGVVSIIVGFVGFITSISAHE